MRAVRRNRRSGGVPPGHRRLQITESAPAHAGTRALRSCAAFRFNFGANREGIHLLTDTSVPGLSKLRAIR